MKYVFKTMDGGVIEINRNGKPDDYLWSRYKKVSLKFEIFGFYILKWI